MNIFDQIKAAEQEGKTILRIPVKDKKSTLSLFAELVKTEYTPSFEDDKDGNAFIEIELKPARKVRESTATILELKRPTRVVAVEDNLIKVNFGV